MNKQIFMLCKKLNSYKGIERVISFSDNYIPVKVMKAFLSLVDEDGDILCSTGNLNSLINIQKELSSNGIESEIIFAGDNPQAILSDDKQLCFLGYDITGVSYYHSPVFRIFHEAQNNADLAYMYARFKNLLNSNGLFDNENDAVNFLKLICSDCQRDIFEEDENMRPIKIWGVETV